MKSHNEVEPKTKNVDFQDLPWHLPLGEWEGKVARLEEVPCGVSRHVVLFVNYDGGLVEPISSLDPVQDGGRTSVLITRYLDQSLPYRTLFMSPDLKRYRQHLLDAMAGLIVQLHLSGVYWGDCSLSNTLFRRDAGALRPYLVDAETSEIQRDLSANSRWLPPALRFHDLRVMEENVNGELYDLQAGGLLASQEPGIPIAETGAYIRLRYQSLWDEITREEIINPGEMYRIQERIRALNELGFSIRDVELARTDNGNQLRLKVVVAGRNFHHDQLLNLTGLDLEERQAQKLMNEIHEVKATLSRENNRSTPLSVAAYQWLEKVYLPASERLRSLAEGDISLAELYCQMLEHKWYLSERAQRDVGHQAATEDYIRQFGPPGPGG
jgi:hypothetical protein